MGISLLLLISIFLISFFLTMVGLGGGLIFSPLFVLLGFAKSQAASTSLFLNLVAAASAATVYARKKMVDFPLSIPLIVSSGLTAPVGSFLNQRMELHFFLLLMAAVLILAAARMLFGTPEAQESPPISKRKKIATGIGIGALIGLVGGMLGIGGGVFVVPLLIYLLKTPTKIAAASSTFIVCFSSLTGFAGYLSAGAVDWRFVLPAAVASLIGGQVGSRVMSAKLKGRSIRIIFAVLLVFMSIQLLYRALCG